MACSHADSVLVHVAVTVHVISQQIVFESYGPTLIAGSLVCSQGACTAGGQSWQLWIQSALHPFRPFWKRSY